MASPMTSCVHVVPDLTTVLLLIIFSWSSILF
jgi:hypothetical protein